MTNPILILIYRRTRKKKDLHYVKIIKLNDIVVPLQGIGRWTFYRDRRPQER